jgi:hypothetical protein
MDMYVNLLFVGASEITCGVVQRLRLHLFCAASVAASLLCIYLCIFFAQLLWLALCFAAFLGCFFSTRLLLLAILALIGSDVVVLCCSLDIAGITVCCETR